MDRATWKGFIAYWDTNECKWKRHGESEFVALKSLNDSQNITSEFLNEVKK